jgi:hypothetical protein
MGLVELLRKLGILRYGATAGTYENGAERPTELMMDDVYDARKDLVAGGGGPGGRVVGGRDPGGRVVGGRDPTQRTPGKR